MAASSMAAVCLASPVVSPLRAPRRSSTQQPRRCAGGAVVRCSAQQQEPARTEDAGFLRTAGGIACGVALALSLSAVPAMAANTGGVRLPPLSNDPNRCERAFTGNTIGQANAVSDKILDLRKCNYANNKSDLAGKTLSGALMVDATFEGANLTETVLTKAYAANANFKKTNFTNAVVDRVAFDGSDMRGAIFKNTVLSGATFDNANMQGASFEDALLGFQDALKLCRNTSLDQEAREQIGCRQ
eukprot:jgi/Chlat1/4125/Chrsp269S03958